MLCAWSHCQPPQHQLPPKQCSRAPLRSQSHAGVSGHSLEMANDQDSPIWIMAPMLVPTSSSTIQTSVQVCGRKDQNAGRSRLRQGLQGAIVKAPGAQSMHSSALLVSCWYRLSALLCSCALLGPQALTRTQKPPTANARCS
jgi:hypothetical protein